MCSEISVTKKICDFVLEYRMEDSSREAVELAKRALLDGVGVMVAGRRERQPRLLARALEEMYGTDSFSLPDQVWIASAACHSQEYNDLYFGLPGHPGAILIPAAFYVGARTGATGKELLEAYMAAFETASRVNRILLPVHHEKGFHSTCVSGIIGAALAAGKLLELSGQQMEHALGIACSFASGLRRNFGSDTNSLQVAKASADGVRAAFLAREGMTSCRELLTQPDGFLAAFYGRLEEADHVFSDLKEQSAFLSPGLLLKKYPACYSVYQAVDAALGIREQEDFRMEGIARIICSVPELSFYSLPEQRPDSVYGQRFCVPYCVAAALLFGRLDETCFQESHLRNPQLSDLMEKSVYRVQEELIGKPGYGFSEVEIVYENGKRLRARAYHGEQEKIENWSRERLYTKFKGCVGSAFSEEQTEQLLATLCEIERVPSVKKVMEFIYDNKKGEDKDEID